MNKKSIGESLSDSIKEAKYAAEDAINTGNYKDLIYICKNFGEDAIDIINKSTGSFCGKQDDFDPLPKGDPNFSGGRRDSAGTSGQPGFGSTSRNQYRQHRAQAGEPYRQSYSRKKKTEENFNKSVVKVSSNQVKGHVSSVLCTIFGALGTIGFGIAAFVLACIFIAEGFTEASLMHLSAVFTGVALGSVLTLTAGLRKGKFINRYCIYVSLLGKNHFC